jgi:hypothetical protein
MIDFIKLFNATAKVAKPMSPDFDNAKSLDDQLQDIDVDSLDSLLIGLYMCELYGIPEDKGKELVPVTIREIHDFLMQHKTKEPESIEAAIEAIK